MPRNDFDEQEADPIERLASQARSALPILSPPKPHLPPWLAHIRSVSQRASEFNPRYKPWPEKRHLIYLVEMPESAEAGALVLSLMTRDRRLDGNWAVPKSIGSSLERIAQLPLAEDRHIVAALAGAVACSGYYPGLEHPLIGNTYQLSDPLAISLFPLILQTGRCFLRTARGGYQWLPLEWVGNGAWQFQLSFHCDGPRAWALDGIFERGAERLELTSADLVTRGGFVFSGGRVSPLAEDTPFEWLRYLRRVGSIRVPAKAKEDFLSALLSAPDSPRLKVPEELRYEEVCPTPRPALRIRPSDIPHDRSGTLIADLAFDYEGRLIGSDDSNVGWYQAEARRFIRRDPGAERAAANLLDSVGFRRRSFTHWAPAPSWQLARTKLPRAVRILLDAGWRVEAEGKVFRKPGSFHLSVSTGIDWFELHGEVSYGQASARLPELLEALRRKESIIRLGDSTYGLLPEEWLSRVGTLAAMGKPVDGHMRFARGQAGLLDALLAAQPEASCDASFAALREQLRHFGGVEPSSQPDGFVGRLRDYQRLGVGWMHFLRQFSFGGCLADDMGVGKTAQVLGLLETRRERRAAGEILAPSLAVVPRSLIFNWKQEAARFVPRLRVLDYTGAGRQEADLSGADLVLTTYGTLRRDVLRLKGVEFDYVVLDEAQAIKNAQTDAAKSVRLLKANHRLALSGTPVENHLGELWSLFEFLNPGMLGSASVFKLIAGSTRNPAEETRRLLAHALRPFILRRTKEQVAPELPAKTEQIIGCELDSAQRRVYDEIRLHYRNTLLKRIDAAGMAKSRIQVLEALLRLRQAACHPGLIDPKRQGENSAKLDTLLEHLALILDEGHKALIFSQFTSLLRIVRNRLETREIPYEYLDGATRDRQTPVERFQNNPNSNLFLISLKAGGLGLNLTAAEYVFLLDPWWNPAVAMQAVDRAHRIGQTRPIFAYRLIACNTVEEKILELQQTKRDLAASIINVDNSLIRNLRREDLDLLLS